MKFPRLKCAQSVFKQKDLFVFNPHSQESIEELKRRILKNPSGIIGTFNPNSLYAARKIFRIGEAAIRNHDMEHAIFLNKKGNILLARDKNTGINVDDILPEDELYNAYGTHNHPRAYSEGSFSGSDHVLFHGMNMRLLRGVDNVSTFSMHKEKAMLDKIFPPEEVMSRYNQFYDIGRQKELLNRTFTSTEGVNERNFAKNANIEMAKKYGLKFWEIRTKEL